MSTCLLFFQPFETIQFAANSTKFKAVVLDDTCLNFGYIGCVAVENFDKIKRIYNYCVAYEDNGQAYEPK